MTLSAEPRAREAARAGFVGSASCGSCHAREYGDWRSSDHARAMAAATPVNVLGDFSGVTVHDGRHNASFRREGDRYIIRTDGPGGTVADFTIAETFGVDPLQQYLVLFPDGRRQALPWAWDSRPREQGGQRWYHLMADDPLPASDPLHWTGREQTWNFMCASCHSTGLVRGYGARVFCRAEKVPGDHGGDRRAHPPGRPEQAGRQRVLHRLPRGGMKLRSHSSDYQRISQGSSRSLALYCLGSCEKQREASVTQDGD